LVSDDTAHPPVVTQRPVLVNVTSAAGVVL
jgi:hypothetical protein